MKESIVCQFHDLSHDGQGVGKIDQKVVFVDGALPLEKGLIQLETQKKNFSTGRLLKILEPSKDRIDPVCPKFSHCGGCQIMHLNYFAQLEAKQSKVVNQMKKSLQIDLQKKIAITSSKDELNYRNKIELKVEQGKIGYYKKQSHDFLEIPACFIAKPIFNQLIKELKNHPYLLKEIDKITLRTNQKEDEVTVIFALKPKAKSLKIATLVQNFPKIVGIVAYSPSGQKTLLFGRSFINENILGEAFSVDCFAFLQVNLLQAEKLYQKIAQTLFIEKTDCILDAYCGIGILTCLLAKTKAKVIGLDIVKESIESAKINGRSLGLKNVEFYCEAFEESTLNFAQIDAIILNPPRGGCEAKALHKVQQIKPKMIIYVSCEPATLCRDLKELILQGYEIDDVHLFDLFPQTMHVETFVVLKKY